MVKNDLVHALSELDYCKNQAGVVITDIFRIIGEALTRGESVFIRGFGTFEVKTREGHMIQDPNTKEKRMIEDYRVVSFKPGDNLRDAVKSGDAGKLGALSKNEK